MAPCNIIIIKCYDGTPLPHINNHRTQFKIHSTHFLHSYHPHYTQIHSRLSLLKTNYMHKKVKGCLEFCLFFEFSIYTHPPKVFIHTKTKMGEWKKELIWVRMTRTNLKPIPIPNLKGTKGSPQFAIILMVQKYNKNFRCQSLSPEM